MNQQLYNENRKILRTKYPNLLKAIDNEEAEKEMMAVGVACVENRKVLYAIKDGSQFQLDSLYDSDAIMQLWAGQFQDLSYYTRFVWFGFGNGMYAEKMLEITEKTVEIIIYEPCLSVIVAAMEEFPIYKVLESKRIHLIVPGYTETYEDVLFQYFDYSNKSFLQYGSYLNYSVLFPEEQKNYQEGLQLALNSINSTQSVLVRFGEAYFENTLSNLPYLISGRTLEQLYHVLPKDMPAVIVAAGPSLDKNVEELRKFKNKAFIIAVDTAASALLKYNIEPDVFITVDGKKIATHFTDERLKKIPVICCLHGNKDALGMHEGPKFFFDDENPYVMEFFQLKKKEFAGLSTGGSVANDALSLADTLRFQTIILVGQDLAYTNDQTHAASTVSGELNGEIGNRDTIELEGYYGGKVISSSEFQLYQKWFQDYIAEKPYLRVFNCTEGGANIKGALNLPLREVLEKECNKTFPFKETINEIPDFFTREEQEEFQYYMENTVEKLNYIAYEAECGIRDYEKMRELVCTDKYHSKEMLRLSKKTREMTDKIEKNPVMSFIEYRLQFETTVLLERVYDKANNEKEELIISIDQGKEYLNIIRKTIKEVTPILKKRLIDQALDETVSKNRIMAEIQGLLGKMQLSATKAGKYWDE
ncbi:MAG: DUF115 domain-containing protein [Lachnospiraceae bacterium]|nr:DUF115 domain-containing protein [Lachnospiraceae bacterium]